MHELAIANSLFQAVQTEAQRHPGMRVGRVGLRIGELSGVDPEALRFSFDAIVKETPFDPLPLEIELCPRRHCCPGCGHTFPVREPDYASDCPRCGGKQTECVSGTELEFSYLELEEP